MPLFTVDRRTRSCFVDKAILKRLEDYILARANELPENPNVPVEAQGLSVEITDRIGKETLDSISDFAHPQFFDGTKQVDIHHVAYRPGRLEVTARFSKDREDSVVRVVFDGPAAREFVAGFMAGIDGILLQSTTFNSWFRPDTAVRIALIALTSGILGFAGAGIVWGSNVPRSALILSLAVPAYALITMFKPYTTFDTRSNMRVTAVGNWLITGTVAFILFTVIGEYLRLKWLGF